MEIVRLHTISVPLDSTSYLLVPVAIDAGEADGDRARCTRQHGSLTPAQSAVLFCHAVASPDVAEQVRALAHGEFTDADVGGDREELSTPDDVVSFVHWRRIRCTGGRVYWW